MSSVTEDNSRVNRPITLPACVNSGFASAIGVFVIGLVSGVPGGLLLGITTVTVLQSLELLADNGLLMDQFEKYIMDNDYVPGFLSVHYNLISIFTEMFCVFSTTLSLVAGIYFGLFTYSLVIKKRGEAAMGKALGYAGPACLTGVTATGYLMGIALKSFLSVILYVPVSLCYFILGGVICLFTFITKVWFNSDSYNSLFCWPVIISSLFALGYISKIRLVLGAVLTPIVLAVKELEKSHSFKLITTPFPLMLIICDVYNIAGQQTVSLQSTNSKNTYSAVLEAIFVGILASLQVTVIVGMSLFVYWQRGGAGKICAAAAGSGGAVLTAIKAALPVLGPGPSIGALMGVAGAVGVSVSAAVAVTDQHGQGVGHCGIVGRLGVTVGAAVGAFLYSCTHSGLSGLFMALCAATIPVGAFVKLPSLWFTFWMLILCSLLCMYITAIILLFTHTIWWYHVLGLYVSCIGVCFFLPLIQTVYGMGWYE